MRWLTVAFAAIRSYALWRHANMHHSVSVVRNDGGQSKWKMHDARSMNRAMQITET